MKKTKINNNNISNIINNNHENINNIISDNIKNETFVFMLKQVHFQLFTPHISTCEVTERLIAGRMCLRVLFIIFL